MFDQKLWPNWIWTNENFKGSPDLGDFIFEINVWKSRIRHSTTLNYNYVNFNRFWDDRDLDNHLKFRIVQCRIWLFPTLISKRKRLESELPSISWTHFGRTVRRFLTINRTKFIKYLFISLKSKWQKEVNCCIQNIKSGLWIGSKKSNGVNWDHVNHLGVNWGQISKG